MSRLAEGGPAIRTTAFSIAGACAGIWVAAKLVEQKFDRPVARLALVFSSDLRKKRAWTRGAANAALAVGAVALAIGVLSED
ncbi:MAG TPA: hypothetical protein VM534_09040 [Thermoanaerobaculia bacterium]|nr:hypothetical protein [Thermoanaerobaculia bacterium]